jgi:hypothetical protein
MYSGRKGVGFDVGCTAEHFCRRISDSFPLHSRVKKSFVCLGFIIHFISVFVYSPVTMLYGLIPLEGLFIFHAQL